MLLGSILVDGLTLIFSSSQSDRFTFVLIPLLEMIVKCIIVGVALQHQYSRTRQSDKLDDRLDNRHSKNQSDERNDGNERGEREREGG
jgi:hypothetical protein